MAETLFLLKKILTPLVLPPTGLLLCAMLGLALLGRWPRLGKLLSWSGLTLLLVLSLPATSTMLLDAVDIGSGLGTSDAHAAQAIVILGGGRMRAPEYGGSTVSGSTLERIRYGAKLAHELQLPILVTGGAVYGGGPAEAELMAEALQQSFATQVKWIENRSRDTHQNATLSAAILKANGIHTVLLVTHDIHQRRATMEFAAAGIKAVPAPVSITTRSGRGSFPSQLPNAGALGLSSQALHEIIGTVVLAPGKAAAP
jgi:uncharacterized SAM-binding protein YcdF (DUF218 family)